MQTAATPMGTTASVLINKLVHQKCVYTIGNADIEDRYHCNSDGSVAAEHVVRGHSFGDLRVTEAGPNWAAMGVVVLLSEGLFRISIGADSNLMIAFQSGPVPMKCSEN